MDIFGRDIFRIKDFKKENVKNRTSALKYTFIIKYASIRQICINTQNKNVLIALSFM